MQSYANQTFSTASNAPKDEVVDLQLDLRRLGYLSHGIDGVFGAGTARAVHALTIDLVSPASAPGNQHVAAYNKGRVTSIGTALSPEIAACMADMLADNAFPKLPDTADPATANTQAIAAVRNAPSNIAPTSFLLAIVQQESDNQHFNVPAPGGADRFVILGLDRNDQHFPDRITSRGYGLGQYTLFYHPPQAADVDRFIVNVNGNVSQAYSELRDKFDHYVVGPTSTASDRIAEHGHGPLRLCAYAPDDARYLRDCGNCARSAKTVDIACTGPDPTPFYDGAAAGDVYQVTQYYPNTHYTGVPDRADFGCDWPYATRRYNGAGVNSYHYQTHILLNLAKLA